MDCTTDHLLCAWLINSLVIRVYPELWPKITKKSHFKPKLQQSEREQYDFIDSATRNLAPVRES
jgi:hypothetical protein